MILTTFCALTAVVITAGIPSQVLSLSEELEIEEAFVLSSLDPDVIDPLPTASSLLSLSYAGELEISPIDISSDQSSDGMHQDAQAREDEDNSNYDLAGLDRMIFNLSLTSHSSDVYATFMRISEDGEPVLALEEPAFRTTDNSWAQSDGRCLDMMKAQVSTLSGGSGGNSLSNPFILATCIRSSSDKIYVSARRMMISASIAEFPNILTYDLTSSCYRTNPYNLNCDGSVGQGMGAQQK
ncbi:MAG: hypothetical protein KDD55_05345 [Bdellovibrionales bacterium]|nr:hypothetical protein [Bdellovibrionales bacterium]